MRCCNDPVLRDEHIGAENVFSGSGKDSNTVEFRFATQFDVVGVGFVVPNYDPRCRWNQADGEDEKH